MRVITCVHQGYELYGSDRTFVSCVIFLRDLFPDAIFNIILPKAGLLSAHLVDTGFRVEIHDLWVLRKSYGWLGLALRGLRLPSFVRRAARLMDQSDLVYINTAVILDFMLASRWSNSRAVLHLHEIPGGFVVKVLRLFVRFSRAAVVFNSRATQSHWAIPKAESQFMVHNGVDLVVSADPTPTLHQKLRVLMIGRINAGKGQELLIDALTLLSADQLRRIEVQIVGDVFEGAPFRIALQDQIAASGLDHIVSLVGFADDPSTFYDWCDLVVVPSRHPESFGLVAIEAMSNGKPVIAADHGGISEIVVDRETGWLFEPNSAQALCEALTQSFDDEIRLKFGANGRQRYLARFTLSAFQSSFNAAILKVVHAGSEAR